MINTIHLSDCFNLLSKILDQSVDLIIADLPYEITNNKWDTAIDMNKLWPEHNRILKPHGVSILFGQNKFSARVMLSNAEAHRYNIIWEKTQPSGHLNAKRRPLSCHEDIMVFYSGQGTYNPQKTSGHARKTALGIHKRNSKKSTNYGDYSFVSYDSTDRYPRCCRLCLWEWNDRTSLH